MPKQGLETDTGPIKPRKMIYKIYNLVAFPCQFTRGLLPYSSTLVITWSKRNLSNKLVPGLDVFPVVWYIDQRWNEKFNTFSHLEIWS